MKKSIKNQFFLQETSKVKQELPKFMIKHYAGEVEYNATGFVEKNQDTLFNNAVDAMVTSKSPIVASLFESMFILYSYS
jgi:myosin heavy subunit